MFDTFGDVFLSKIFMGKTCKNSYWAYFLSDDTFKALPNRSGWDSG